MKILFLCILSLACIACESKTKSESKPTVSVVKPAKPTVKKPVLDPKMAKVHAALRANKKIVAIKEYRTLHRFPLHAAKQAVEIEKTKLGMPSMDTVYNLYWNGKEKEARDHLKLVFKSLNEASAQGKLKSMTERIGPPTEENMNVHIKNGKLLESLMIYRHLHPEAEMPEMYKIVSAKMPKKVTY